jgi:hypothetical protein
MSDAEISARRTIEGVGTGKVENVTSDTTQTTKESAIDLALSKVDLYGVVGKALRYRTLRDGLAAGQIQTIDLGAIIDPGMGSYDFLLQAVEMEERDGLIFYSVDAVYGPVADSWTKTFMRLAQSAKSGSIREGAGDSDMLISLRSFSKTWTAIEDPNIFQVLTPNDAPTPSSGFLPCFEPVERVRYCSLYVSGAEVFRKQATSVVIADDDSIVTATTYISPSEANDTMYSHVGWWGGDAATATIGTGVEIDKQAFAEQKTSLEAWQIEKYDHRWA